MSPGIVFVINLIETSTSFQSLNASLTQTVAVPGCETLMFRSREYWECFIRRSAGIGVFHYFGSCRMGQVGDTQAVVDSKLRYA